MRITYSQRASETVTFAAAELEAYLKRMLTELPGEEWEIRLETDGSRDENPELSIGRDGASRGEPDGPPRDGNRVHERHCDGASSQAPRESSPQEDDRFTVRVTEEGGTITGSNDRSVLLGVYGYLHVLGCRFLAPRPECEWVPVITKERLAADFTRNAAFRHRGVCIEGATSYSNIRDFIDWLPKVGFNSFFLQFQVPYTFLARWYHHELNPLKEAEPFTYGDAGACLEALEAEIRKRGLMLHRRGHGWTGEALGYQVDSWEVADRPLDERTRPLAAELGGVRGLYHGIPANTNLCYSSREAIDRFTEKVVEYVREHPGGEYVHVWLADTFNNICECEECRKTTLSDQYVDLLNEIDRRLTELGSDAKLVFLLYQELLWPPVQAKIANPERFVLMFAPISRTFSASYPLGQIPEQLPVYVRNKVTLPDSLTENLAFLKAWKKQFHGDSFMYDYPLGRAHYGDPGYLHIARVIGGDIRRLKALELEGYMSCQELRVALPNALPDYVMGRMLFDETAETEAVIREYFEAAYGARTEKARIYLEKLSEQSFCDYLNGAEERVDPVIAGKMKAIRQICGEFLLDEEGDPGKRCAVDASALTNENRLEEEHSPIDGKCLEREDSLTSENRLAEEPSPIVGNSLEKEYFPACENSMAEKEQDVSGVFWKLLRYHARYTTRLAEAVQYLAEGDGRKAMEKWEDMREYICRQEPEYQAYLDVYRLLDVTRNYTGFK